jgi:hypothetical protein
MDRRSCSPLNQSSPLRTEPQVGVKDARAATIEPDEQSAIGPTQMRPAWRSLLQDIKLMPQYHDLGFQLLSRLEAVEQHADEQEADCNHAAIMF